MNRRILKSLLFAVAALPLIALGAYVLSTHDRQRVPDRPIILDLDRQDGMKEYIQEWIPASDVDRDMLLGSIEDESVTMIVRRNDAACSFDAALITVNMDVAKGGKVHRIFISSRGMALTEAVSSMKQILAMMDAKPEKLNAWTKAPWRGPKRQSRGPGTPFRRWMPGIRRSCGRRTSNASLKCAGPMTTRCRGGSLSGRDHVSSLRRILPAKDK